MDNGLLLVLFMGLVFGVPILIMLHSTRRTVQEMNAPKDPLDPKIRAANEPGVHIGTVGNAFWDSMSPGLLDAGATEAMWKAYGSELDTRDAAMAAWASTVNGDFVRVDNILFTEQNTANVLFNDGILWQVRNRTVYTQPTPTGDVTVTVADVNRMTNTKNGFTWNPTTVAVVWFDTDYRLTVVPPYYAGMAGAQIGLSGLRLGPKMKTGVETFDDVLRVYTEHAGFARLFLNPAVQARLMRDSARIWVITDGMMVASTGYGWVPPDKIPEFVDDLVDVAQSGRAAAK